MLAISEIKHPDYNLNLENWFKWRLCYEGGEVFRNTYLIPYSIRESDDDFKARKSITPIPRFAGAAIDEVKNSIFQRMSDIGRKGGSKVYDDAQKGLRGGVDNIGSSMNMFIGQYVLPEMLVMKKVGVFVDMPKYTGVTVADGKGLRPYLYMYPAENICSWSNYTDEGETFFNSVLLRDFKLVYDDETGLPVGKIDRYRRLWLDKQGFVNVQYYNWEKAEGSGSVTPDNKSKEELKLVGEAPIRLGIKKIPFVTFELDRSMIQDIAEYQIALLNLGSGDVNYSLNANFPFYTEEYDVRENPGHLKQEGSNSDTYSGTKEIKVGTMKGRRRPKGLAEPKFIHPSPEPLLASMKKQQEMKEDIRQLLGLNLINSKNNDSKETSLESGLANIGLELENGERRISEIYADYLGEKKSATINYPRKYSLKTETERREEAKEQKELQGAAPSKTFQKEVAKQICETMLGGKVSDEKLTAIFNEVEEAQYITSDPDAITKDIENGLVTETTASNARGYDGEKEVPKARQEHAAKLEVIATSQAKGGGIGKARGVPTPGVNPKGSIKEKKGKPKRGPNKEAP